MSKSHQPRKPFDYKKVEIQEVISFLMKHGYSHCCLRDKDYILSKGDFVVISKEETVTYKQVKGFLEKLNLNIDDFDMTLESADNKKECEEFIKSLENGRLYNL